MKEAKELTKKRLMEARAKKAAVSAGSPNQSSSRQKENIPSAANSVTHPIVETTVRPSAEPTSSPPVRPVRSPAETTRPFQTPIIVDETVGNVSDDLQEFVQPFPLTEKFKLVKISGSDDNCGPRTLSYAVHRTEDKHADIRKQVHNAMKDEESGFKNFFEANGRRLDLISHLDFWDKKKYDRSKASFDDVWSEFLDYTEKSGRWFVSEHFEVASQLFGLQIVFFRYNSKGLLEMAGEAKPDGVKPRRVYVLHTGSHYDYLERLDKVIFLFLDFLTVFLSSQNNHSLSLLLKTVNGSTSTDTIDEGIGTDESLQTDDLNQSLADGRSKRESVSDVNYKELDDG